MNENTSFTKMFLLNSLNAQTDHDVRLNKLRHKKAMTSNLINIRPQCHSNGDTVKDAVLLQNRKFISPSPLKFGLNVFLSSQLRKRVPTLYVSNHKQRSYLEFKVAKS